MAQVYDCYVCDTSIYPTHKDKFEKYGDKGHVCQYCMVRRDSNRWFLDQESTMMEEDEAPMKAGFDKPSYDYMRKARLMQEEADAADPLCEQAYQTALSCVTDILDEMDKDNFIPKGYPLDETLLEKPPLESLEEEEKQTVRLLPAAIDIANKAEAKEKNGKKKETVAEWIIRTVAKAIKMFNVNNEE